MKPIYNFPYFGAGKATYFDRAFVEVVFKEEPNKKQKKLIEKNVPFPIAEISWEKNFMTAGSGQFAHVDIATTYQTKDGSDPEDKENWEDDRWFFTDSFKPDCRTIAFVRAKLLRFAGHKNPVEQAPSNLEDE